MVCSSSIKLASDPSLENEALGLISMGGVGQGSYGPVVSYENDGWKGEKTSIVKLTPQT